MKKIAIDVDGVLAFDTPFKWGLEIFKNFENRKSEFKRYEDFQIAITKNKGLKVNKNQAYDFWKSPTLYDNINELNFAIRNLINQLRGEYPNASWIVLSDCFKEHIDSKVNFCSRVLPFDEFEFYDTKNKYEYKAEIYIDDKPENLIQCKKKYGNECETILIKHFYNDLSLGEYDYIDKIIYIF